MGNTTFFNRTGTTAYGMEQLTLFVQYIDHYLAGIKEIMLGSYRIGVSSDCVFTADISGSNGKDLSLNLITNHCQSAIPDYLYSRNQYMDSGDIFFSDGKDLIELIKFLIAYYQLNEITIKNNCLCLFHSRNET